MPNPPQLPPYIYGLHDVGGQDLMLSAGRPGWILDTVDLRSQVGTDYSLLSNNGISVIVRLNYGYGTAGTIPPSPQYDTFAKLCANYAKNSPGARIWVIGNEMNISAERPQLDDGSREIITPEKYARCFVKCRTAIRRVSGHSDDWVIPGAIGPYNNETAYPGNPNGDWVHYFVDLLSLLGSQMDGITLHCYTHGFDPAQISDDRMMDPPFNRRHFNFRAYRDFLNAIPDRFRGLPVLITETNPYAGWRDANIGWIQSAYQEISDWNSSSNQPVQALCLFRWQTLEDHPEWGLQDKHGLIDDFEGALAAGYRVRPYGVVRKTTNPPAAQPTAPTRPATIPITTPTGAAGTPPAAPGRTPNQPIPTPPDFRVRWVQAPAIAKNTMKPNAVLTGSVIVKNVGAKPWSASGPNPVRLGYHWFDPNGNATPVAPYKGNWRLANDVPPGGTARFDNVELRAPQWQGKYTLKWDMVQEGVAWFGTRSSPTLDASVQVGNAGVGSAASPAQVGSVMPTFEGWAALFTFHDTPISLIAGQTVPVNLGVRNVGTNRWLKDANPPVHIGYKWFDQTGAQQLDVQDLRTALPSDIAPGEDKTFGSSLAAPKVPGKYHLRWDLVVEGVTWFADTNSPPLVVPVSVTKQPSVTTLWRAEANLNCAEVAFTLDGDSRTFWDSQTTQAPGQWFRLNMSSPKMIDGVQFLSPGKGFPAGYTLRVSENGRDWAMVGQVQSNNVSDVTAVFAPSSVQYVQMDITSAPNRPSSWMISEILLHLAESWTASASVNSGQADRAIDNHPETSWTSGTPQTPGMWFQVDLGRVESVSGISLLPPAEEQPAGFRVCAWDEAGSRWQIVFEQAQSQTSVNVTFPKVQTRFLAVQLLQPNAKAWAIAEVRILRTMEAWLRPA